eukprot:CAMPEP_0171470840 /NCGR_PEP_ID=MMETSP0946-20130122/369_1 /TAXON_ID=109269 /ORGANISM="Vaucheria litorea, Strain CCMP2940" /LENGTH=479 /DNA_ID=CAMNT_0012000257 /DNA_START=440 /DNA_END=1879 /DNA_ORIENTATION=+
MEDDLILSIKGKNWGKMEKHTSLPSDGTSPDQILSSMKELAKTESRKWSDGKVSGAVYHGGRDHLKLLDEAYSLFGVSNPLHIDLWPSVVQFEAEIIAMVADLLGGGSKSICGSLTSGGTESIILAAKSHVEYFRKRGIAEPEIVACVSAHAAIEKACSLMGVRLKKVGMDRETFKANFLCLSSLTFTSLQISIKEVERSLSVNTVLIYASAPTFPHGIVDPIEELSEIALRHGCGLHVDCCLGGFFLPFLAGAGKSDGFTDKFDFSLSGVTSISCDTHKYGYSSKGTSVVLYRDKELRENQYFCYPDWTGGLYMTPTLAGSRPGGLVAACWASLMSTGRSGYTENVRKIRATVLKIIEGIERISELYVIGEPKAMIVCFGSRSLNIYSVADKMAQKGWNLNSLQNPACVHLCATVMTVGVENEFIDDLEGCVREIGCEGSGPGKSNGSVGIYGMAGSIPSGTLLEVMKKYADIAYRAE